MFIDLGVKIDCPVDLCCDNKSALLLAANPVFHKRTKHLETYVHFVREKVAAGVIKTIKIESINQVADILTKGL